VRSLLLLYVQCACSPVHVDCVVEDQGFHLPFHLSFVFLLLLLSLRPFPGPGLTISCRATGALAHSHCLFRCWTTCVLTPHSLGSRVSCQPVCEGPDVPPLFLAHRGIVSCVSACPCQCLSKNPRKTRGHPRDFKLSQLSNPKTLVKHRDTLVNLSPRRRQIPKPS